MWKQNFMFRYQDSTPLKQSENELFHDTDPALDSAGLQLEKFISVWIQGDGKDGEPPVAYTNVYVRTATLDINRRAGFLQPLQGRTHQIKQVLTDGQKQYLREWLSQTAPQAWAEAEDHFKVAFDAD
jgi:hypothetical protein